MHLICHREKYSLFLLSLALGIDTFQLHKLYNVTQATQGCEMMLLAPNKQL